MEGFVLINGWKAIARTSTGTGGHGRRSFRKGDELLFKDNRIYFAGLLKEEQISQALRWRVDSKRIYKHPHEVYIMKGNEWEYLTGTSQYDFQQNNFIIHPSSDRMGYHLHGNALKLSQPLELISAGVNFGTLQLLPNGQLIILMADHQTTGGYPRIGHVISAHLPKLSQLRPSENIQFKLVDLATAENLYLSQQQDLQILERACRDHLNALVC